MGVAGCIASTAAVDRFLGFIAIHESLVGQ